MEVFIAFNNVLKHFTHLNCNFVVYHHIKMLRITVNVGEVLHFDVALLLV